MVSSAINIINLCFTDQLAIVVTPSSLLIGRGTTAEFTSMASGVSTNENNFRYQWKKRGSNNLPSKVTGVNEEVLTIPSVTESDEGQYYCNVTNEWERSVESNNVTLSIFGMFVCVCSVVVTVMVVNCIHRFML